MGCICTCPKVDTHFNAHQEQEIVAPTKTQHQTTNSSKKRQLTTVDDHDLDENKNQHSDAAKKQQAPALVCKFGKQ